jgi:hypothetical protein
LEIKVVQYLDEVAVFYGSGDCIFEEDWDRMEDLSQMEQDEKYAGKVEQSVGFPSPLIGENENQKKLRLVPTLTYENLHRII